MGKQRIARITLLPGEISEQDLMNITGDSKDVLFRHRKYDGLPYTKRGKYVIYQLDAVQKWLADRWVDAFSEAHDEVISEFEKDFKNQTQTAEMALRTSRAQFAVALFTKQVPDAPEIEKKLDDVLAAAIQPVITNARSVAVYRLARNLERTFVTPLKGLAVALELPEDGGPISVITTESKRLAKQILMKSFPDVPEADADEMIAKIDGLHEYFSKKRDGTATEDDLRTAFGGRR